MSNFQVPARENVSAQNQAIFDTLKSKLGFTPNLYATFALSNTALADYLALQNRKTSLSAKEREIVNLAVSQVNECAYCLAAHTAIGKMNGFSDEQIMEIRQGRASFDAKFDALASFARQVTLHRGKPSPAITEQFLAAGYTQENLVDTLMLVGDKIISNFLHGITQIPVDFPEAAPLPVAAV